MDYKICESLRTRIITKKIKTLANAFSWNTDLQARADEYASREIILLGEEVNKGIQGIVSHDNGRMLNCVFGLSLGLARILRVQHGIILSSDNEYFACITALHKNVPKVLFSVRTLFGISKNSLESRVLAGLALYQEVAEGIMPVLDGEQEVALRFLRKNISSLLTFRPATIKDLALLKYWDSKPQVIASDPDDELGW